jgi:hypothetical protein
MKRMTIKISVGEKYLNRSGFEMHVIEKVEDLFLVISSNNTYNAGDYGNGYFVCVNGGFGNTPNPRDLITKIITQKE